MAELVRKAFWVTADLVSIDYRGVRLVKRRLVVIWYAGLFFTLTILAKFVSEHENLSIWLHPENANEIMIGSLTIILALLVPVAIVLVEDAKGRALDRQTIVKNIIRLGVTPLVLIAACATLLVPQGIIIPLGRLTLRSVAGVVVICAIYFILMSFYRSYKWLTDGAVFHNGLEEKPKPGESEPDVFVSYRFAQIVQIGRNARGHSEWFHIWAQWYPVDYEAALHAAFFEREKKYLDEDRPERYGTMTLELEAYLKYFGKRNEKDFRFQMNYPKEFFEIYGRIRRRIEKDRKGIARMGLWRAEATALEISKRMIKNSMDYTNVWELLTAMQAYVEQNNLLKIGNRKSRKDDPVLSFFLQTMFDRMYNDQSGNMRSYGLESFLTEHPEWCVTYQNLYINKYNLSFVIANEFEKFLEKQLDEGGTEENRYRIDGIMEIIFPDADPITLAELFWFKYNSQHQIESLPILQDIIARPRSFGIFGRTFGFTPTTSKDSDRIEFVAFQKQQSKGAVEFFANYYAQYFRGFWNLEELVKTAELLMKNPENKKDEKTYKRLVSLHQLLGDILQYYKVKTKKKSP